MTLPLFAVSPHRAKAKDPAREFHRLRGLRAYQETRLLLDAAGRPLCKQCGDGTLAVQRGDEKFKCIKHLRFSRMRLAAKQNGKVVPSLEELERLFILSRGMICADCGKQMVWERVQGQREDAVSLQHYRDGTFGLVCSSCNTRHHYMPGDDFRKLSPGHRVCNVCRAVKPIADFHSITTRDGRRLPYSRCRPCVRASRIKTTGATP